MPSLVSKNRDFKGPRTHHGIITQIRKDAFANKGRYLSRRFIERTIRLYFSPRHGIGVYYRKGNNFLIKNLGWFKPTPARRSVSIQKKIKKRQRERANVNNYYAREKAKREN